MYLDCVADVDAHHICYCVAQASSHHAGETKLGAKHQVNLLSSCDLPDREQARQHS
jgi:hypothetical protein